MKKEKIINEKNNDGWAGLHIAAAKGFDDVGKYLIDNGADVNAKSILFFKKFFLFLF